MDPRFARIFRPIAAVTVIVFTLTATEWWNFAFAAQAQQTANPASGVHSKSSIPAVANTPEKRFSDALVGVLETLDQLDQDLSGRKDLALTLGTLRGYGELLGAADPQIREEFARTEGFLKDKGLPQVMLNRLAQAVLDYDANYQKLKTHLDGLLSLEADQKSQRDQISKKLKEGRDYFGDKIKKPRHDPLDPENLPNRTPKVKEREPRLKKEEFTELNPPIQLAYVGDLPDLRLVSHTPTDLPTEVDLAETIEVQFTPELQAKAMELEKNPVKIYNWVRNNIDFTPTWGSIQGAHHCLLTKQCNAFDTSSLLIALLRSSGIHARYVMGTIEVPIEQVKNWVGGFTDQIGAARNFIASNGIPSKMRNNFVQMEHVWVEAYIDYVPSRGAAHKEGDSWIPLDASFKQFEYSDPMDLPAAVGFDTQALLDEVSAGTTIDPSGNFVSGVPEALILQRTQEYLDSVSQYVTANPDLKLSDLYGTKKVARQDFTGLPALLPYKILVQGGSATELSDGVRHRVRIDVSLSPFLTTDFGYVADFADLAGKRVTLSYQPETPEDEALIAEYGSIEATPSYLLNLKPEIKVEGVSVGVGSAVGAGEEIKISVTFISPVEWTDTVITKSEDAGAVLAIVFDLNGIPLSLVEKRLAVLEAAHESGETANGDVVGETLHLLGLFRYAELAGMSRIKARYSGVVYSRYPAGAIVAEWVNVSSAFGAPLGMSFAGLFMDAFHRVVNPYALDGNGDKAVRFMINEGLDASATEHAVFEQAYNVPAVSTVQVLKLANAGGIPIYEVTNANQAAVIPILGYTSDIINDIQNAALAGRTVIVPEYNITYHSWVGTGYLIVDPETGATGAQITGNLAGGQIALLMDCIEDIAQFMTVAHIPASVPGQEQIGTLTRFLQFVASLGDIQAALDDPVASEHLLAQADLAAEALGLTDCNICEVVAASIDRVVMFFNVNHLLDSTTIDIEFTPLLHCAFVQIVQSDPVFLINQTKTISANANPPGGAFLWTTSDPSVLAIEGSETESAVTIRSVSIGAATISVEYALQEGLPAADEDQAYSFEVTIKVPSGDPVFQGSDTNEFTLAGPNGVADLPFKAIVEPFEAQNKVDPMIKWSFEPVPTKPVLTWERSWPGDDSAGQGLAPGGKLTGYPPLNSGFGRKGIKIQIIDQGGISLWEEVGNIELFFDKNAIAINRISPNWFYYWLQAYGGRPNTIYKGPKGSTFGEQPGMLTWSYSGATDKTVLWIYDAASKHDPGNDCGPIGVRDTTGIATFFDTIIHEDLHAQQQARADAIVGLIPGTPWQYGWSFPWAQAMQGKRHNHWGLGLDGQPGKAGVDDDGDGTVDNFRSDAAGELGLGGTNPVTEEPYDEPLFYPGYDDIWPLAFGIPSPPCGEFPHEHEAYRAETDSESTGELMDWSDGGKQHHTVHEDYIP